jgi:hypothetical protein
MTFTATGEPSNIPPRILLELETDVAGATFNTLTVSRDGTPIRLQPPTGTEATETYDYEMPFGTAVQYTASGSYLPFVAPEWTENWAAYPGSWTELQAGWALGAGDTLTSSTYQAIITRTTAGTIQRVSVTDPSNVAFQVVTAASDLVALVTTEASGVTLYTSDGSGGTVVGSGSYTMTLIDGVVTVTADDASWSLEGTYSGTPSKVALVSLGGEFAQTSSFSTTGNADRIAVASGGNIYALDITAKLVRKFNSAGVFQTSWSTTGTPSGIAVDSGEAIYVTDTTSDLVRKYTSTGTAGITWSTTGNPLGLGIDAADAVYVLDETNNLVRKYTNLGVAGITFGSFTDVTQIAVAPDGSVYVLTDPDDDEIEKFTSAGATGTPATISANTDAGDLMSATNSTLNLSNGSVVEHYTSAGVNSGSTTISPAVTGGTATTAAGAFLIGDKSNKTIRVFTSSTASIGVIEVTPAVAAVAFYELATATLNITEAWLIHPAQPTLSVSIDTGAWRDAGLNVDPATSQQNVAEAAVTLHQPVGRTTTVAIATGNRLDELWPLVLLAPTLDARDDVRAILRDQTPLLLRSPASFGWDLNDGYYSVQGVQYDRLTANLNSEYRRITLPLVPSDPPVVRVATQRSWSDVIEQNATWGDVVLRYETWDDLILGIS